MTTISFYDVIKVILILAALAGILYGALYVMKKYFYSFQGAKSGQIPMKVLATQSIMPKRYISAVRIMDKVFLIAISDQQITLLDKLDEVPEDLLADDSEIEKLNFMDVFKQSMGKK